MTGELKVLFVSTYPELGPSARYRICQHLPGLRARGVTCDFSPLFTNTFYRRFYAPGSVPYKATWLALAHLRRLAQAIVERINPHDVIVVQREAALLGPPIFELVVRLAHKIPIVFDLDDATFHSAADTKQISAHPNLRRWLKSPSKVARIAALATDVVAGGKYIADWARQFCDRVTVIPTVVDGERFKPLARLEAPSVPVIGWVGSHSAASQLDMLCPVFERLAKTHRFRVKIVGAGREFRVPGVEIASLPWTLETEVEHFQTLDIGVCPLFDDQWSRGKPGFKPLVYMACGVPQVSSPIGGAVDVLTDGREGFFARSADDWYGRLDRLLEEPALRQRMAASARETFERKYSLGTQTDQLHHVLSHAAEAKSAGTIRRAGIEQVASRR